MKVLAIETSCEHASIALLSSGEVIGRALEGHANHSEHILEAVSALLAEGECTIRQLDALAFGSGPGAFTGLRLACGVVQGLALGAGLGIAAVGSLAALAMQAAAPRVFAATDARMGEIYHCAFERGEDGLPVAIGEAGCCPPEMLALPEGNWWGTGSAFSAYGERIETTFPDRWLGFEPGAVPRAEDVARLALRELREGRLLAPEMALPLYVRDKVALTTAERLARGGRA